jgi:hypothetical protein
MALTAYSALFPVTGLYCHRHQRDAERVFANLNASVGASEPHGFAVRENVLRLNTLPRPPHPAPNARDDRDPPLLGARDGEGDSSDFSSKGSEIFFTAELDSRFARRARGRRYRGS